MAVVKTVSSLLLLDNSIEAPPSFKPAKKFCDITGLPVSHCLGCTNNVTCN